MSKGATFLNYTAFLILYITSFIIIYVKNTEIIGFYFLFIVNTACTLYNLIYFSGLSNIMEAIPTTIAASLFISGVFHTVCFIFVIMMISDMRVKYTNTYGTPISLPPEYAVRFELFKQLTITTFSLCALLLIILLNAFDYLNISFANLGSIKNIIIYYFPQVFILILSLIPIIISSIQLMRANEFSKLSRKHLMR